MCSGAGPIGLVVQAKPGLDEEMMSPRRDSSSPPVCPGRWARCRGDITAAAVERDGVSSPRPVAPARTRNGSSSSRKRQLPGSKAHHNSCNGRVKVKKLTTTQPDTPDRPTWSFPSSASHAHPSTLWPRMPREPTATRLPERSQTAPTPAQGEASQPGRHLNSDDRTGRARNAARSGVALGETRTRGCRPMARTSAFQAENAGSSPVSRSTAQAARTRTPAVAETPAVHDGVDTDVHEQQAGEPCQQGICATTVVAAQ